MALHGWKRERRLKGLLNISYLIFSHNVKKRLKALRFQYIPDIIVLYCDGVYESAAVPRAGQAVEDLQCIHGMQINYLCHDCTQSTGFNAPLP